MAKFNPPKEFDFDPSGWAEWFTRWSRYRTLSIRKKNNYKLTAFSIVWETKVRVFSMV